MSPRRSLLLATLTVVPILASAWGCGSAGGGASNAPQIRNGLVDADGSGAAEGGVSTTAADASVDASPAEAGDDGGDDGGAADGAADGPSNDGGTDAAPPPTYITWDISHAVFAGNGCPTAGTRVDVTSQGVTITYDSLAVSLPVGVAQTSDRETCVTRIPVTIPKGMYVSRFEQDADYAIDKTAGASAALSTRLTAFTMNVDPLTANFAAGLSVKDPAGHITRSDAMDPAAMCNPSRTEAGLVQLNVAITGQKPSGAEGVVLSVPSQTIGEGQQIVLSPCP